MTFARPLPDPLSAILDAARIAGEIALDGLRGPRAFSEKARRADIVTDTDKASEAAILTRLRAEFPAATMLTEETGTHDGSSDERFIVDPIDGTTNFAHGYPMFCISIAYERAGELLAGVVHAPALGETFAVQRGAGATFNGAPMHVSNVARVGDALTCTGFHPADFERNAPHFRAVSNRAQAVRRDGSAALDLAYVALGRFDGFWEWDLHAWDVAAGMLLVREAGGTVTRIEGGEPAVDAGTILATNGAIHQELQAILARA
jgi:myo-inositol-1(or 4)-monophosphatase